MADWKPANIDGADFWAGDASCLESVSVIAQAFDNQWVPNAVLNNMLEEGKCLEDVRADRDERVRIEFIRSLINARQVISNRAYLYNNRAVSQSYTTSGAEREAFHSLLRTKAVLPFLFAEKAPHQPPSKKEDFDRDRVAFEAWQEVCREAKPYCLRLAWPTNDGNDDRNRTLIRNLLARPFHQYGKSAVDGDAKVYSEHLGIPEQQRRDFKVKLQEVLDWFGKAPLDDEGNVTFRQREHFYEQFVVKKDSKVQQGFYDKSKPFAAELKRLVDLKYNTNLADALGRYALTPVDSLPRIALQESRTLKQPEEGEISAEQLTALMRSKVFDITQRSLDLPLISGLTLSDVVKVRQELPAWDTYIFSIDKLLRNVSADDLDFDSVLVNVSGILEEVFENYCSLGSSIAELIRKRNEQAVVPAVRVGYGIVLAVAGVPIGMVSLAGGVIFAVGAAIVPALLPAGAPAQVVAKLYFRDPGRQEIMQMETDIMERQLPNAKEGIDKVLSELRRAGFKELDVNPFLDDLPTINHTEEAYE